MKCMNAIISLLLSICLTLSGCGMSAVGGTTTPKQETPTLLKEESETTQTEKAPVSSEQDEAVTEEIKQMQTTTYTLNGVDFTMIMVEAGTFTMGSDNTDAAFNESPAHTVTIS